MGNRDGSSAAGFTSWRHAVKKPGTVGVAISRTRVGKPWSFVYILVAATIASSFDVAGSFFCTDVSTCTTGGDDR